MGSLYEALDTYSKKNEYPFHMPGHKRQMHIIKDPFSVDITEIDGFDNLHHAEGILKEAQERAAELYGAEESFFLVNGSTGGILSAISAVCKRGGKILMARNSHKAAYHGVFLRELKSVYLYPQKDNRYDLNCGQDPEIIREVLTKTPGIQAVFITSPTYDGVVSDVENIARVVHSFGIPLIVDEAHGAHFGFHPYFPQTAVRLGADLVIQSLHKTLPSLTQTAVLHVNGNLTDREKLKQFLGIYQTSSPSYVFMASMDQCIRLIRSDGDKLFEGFSERLEKFYESVRDLRHLHVVNQKDLEGKNCFRFDPSKLILSVKCCNINGHILAEKLREDYHLEMEMEASAYALALTSVMDTEEGFQRLSRALRELDETLESMPEEGIVNSQEPEIVMKISDAWEAKKRRVPLEESCGEISAEFIYLYPPGIPLITPGEIISRELLECILDYKRKGLALQGLSDHGCRFVQVCGNKTVE